MAPIAFRNSEKGEAIGVIVHVETSHLIKQPFVSDIIVAVEHGGAGSPIGHIVELV